MRAVLAIRRAVVTARWHVGAAAALTLGGVFLGYALGGTVPTTESTQSAPTVTVSAPDVFVNNALAAGFLVTGGVLLGVPTAIALIQNGVLVGSLAATATAGGHPAVFVALLAPHAVFELPALWLAAAAGFRAPAGLLAYLRRRRERPVSAQDVRDIVVLVASATVLLLVAALVEAYVSVPLARAFSA
ncbi:stage II sporulation protein M [Halarchaeum sp. P4]|uniref:stage II sporulation protein M n=1 Tax=Halarchaeum sp. P4 TaxID=3421639 RepID=UPI003EB6CD7D